MNRRILTLVAAGAAAAFALALPLSAAPKDTNHNKSAATDSANCDTNDLTIVAPEKLWPPNHKYYTGISVTADDGQDGAVTLETTGTHDGYDGDTGTETNGSGNTADDITTNGEDPAFTTTTNDENGETVVHSESGDDVVTTNWQARAERSGRIKEGRNYTLTAVATFSDGEECTHSVSFNVPHDMRPANR